MRRLAANPRIDLWSVDECHFQQHGTRSRMWVPPEDKDPVVAHAPTRRSIACFGATCLRNGRLVTSLTPKFNAATFADFLRLIIRYRHRNRRMVLILDNAQYHHARTLMPWLRKHRKSLTLLFLPPYSPELNPIERVWKLARRLATHNRYFSALEDLVDAVKERFALWAYPNSQLRRLCAIT